jgi:regulator of nucleoside diphosphate kinase
MHVCFSNNQSFVLEVAMEAIQAILSRSDHTQLYEVINHNLRLLAAENQQLMRLKEKLDSSIVLSSLSVPVNVVTMHSAVDLFMPDKARAMTCMLVFPQETSLSRNRISVLSPLGTALLGSSEGEMIEVNQLSGVRRFIIRRILYQPESARTTGQSEHGLAREWFTCQGPDTHE